jgi:ribonuclease P protein component
MAFQKIKKRSGYVRIAKSQVYARLASVIVQADSSEQFLEGSLPCVGYTASRRVGSAVRRNRAKRRLKAAIFDLSHDNLINTNAVDFVFIATPATADVEFSVLKGHILTGVKKCSRLLEARLSMSTQPEGDALK